MSTENSDRARWNEKYRAEFRHGQVNERLTQSAHLLKRGRVLDLAGGLGQNGAWLASHSNEFRIINADLSDEALARAAPGIARVVVEAAALPFPRHRFDTLLNIRFYDPRIVFADWLAENGTVFFETFTTRDFKYRPDFNPAHRFDLPEIPRVFKGMEILQLQETDDGNRVYLTLIARKLAT